MSAETQRKILEASAKARDLIGKLDAAKIDELTALYEAAANDIEAQIQARAAADGAIRPGVQSDLLQQINARLSDLAKLRDQALQEGIVAAADLGAGAWTSTLTAQTVSRLADDAVRFCFRFQAEDGLKLSDRIWRLDAGALESIQTAIRRSITEGQDASRAAQEYLTRGDSLPAEIRAALKSDQADEIAKRVTGVFMRDPGSAYEQARRVFRTEINRAHGEAYQAGVAESPDAIGVKFLLSPAHKRRDICDMYARANLYGLGPGVYPVNKSPWPAHPNTISFVVVVFSDEVTEDDRKGQQTGIDWLRQQSKEEQESILGKQKAAALQAGKLREEHITANWRDIKEEINGK